MRWASPQLHDIEALGKMVDPGLCGLYPPRSLSRFADIIALCLQVSPTLTPIFFLIFLSLKIKFLNLLLFVFSWNLNLGHRCLKW